MFKTETRKTPLAKVLTAFAVVLLSLTILLCLGNTASAAEAEMDGIKSVNISLQNDIIVKFHTDASTDDGSKIVVVFNGETTEITDNKGGVFSYSGVAPQHLNDDITATMYAADGSTQIGDSVTFSIRTYVERLLALDFDNSGCQTVIQYNAMKELAVNLLNYGAASQSFLGHDTSDLANNTLTDDQKELATETITVTESDKAVNGDMWVGAGVRFDYKLGLYFVFRAESLDGITASINNQVVNPQVYDENENHYVIRYNSFSATNMNSVITAKLIIGDEEQTFAYSIKSYVAAMNGKNDPIAELANATYAYGYSAVAYSAEYELTNIPTVKEKGTIGMKESSKNGYDFTGSGYDSVDIPAYSSEVYEITTTKTSNSPLTISTTYVSDYGTFIFTSGEYFDVNGEIYSRYSVSALCGDSVDVTYDEDNGFTYNAISPVTLSNINAFGSRFTLCGEINVDHGSSTWGINNNIVIGTPDKPAKVSVETTTTSFAIGLWDGFDMLVTEGSSLSVNSTTAPRSIYSNINGSYITIDGELTTERTIFISSTDPSYTSQTGEYSINPNFFVRKGKVTIKNGQLITNFLQVGSVELGYYGVLNITQTAKGTLSGANSKCENTINVYNSAKPIRHAYSNGEVNLNATVNGLTAIDVRTSARSYVTIDSGIKISTSSNYYAVFGCWSVGYEYRLAIHADARFNTTCDMFVLGISKTFIYTYFDTATLNIDGEEKTVFVANKSTKVTSTTTLKNSILSVTNDDGTKSVARPTVADGDFVSLTDTITVGDWAFTKASNGSDTIYYKVK